MKYITRLKISWANTHIVNKLTFLLTAVITVANVTYVYYARKQFVTMSGQLGEMQSSGHQTDQLLSLYKSQLDELKKQRTDTHELAVQAKNQADRALAQAAATNRLASSSAAQVSLSQEQSQMIDRPWIKILDVRTKGNSPIVPALSFQQSDVYKAGTQQTTFQIEVSLKNIGHSMAKATVGFELFLPLWKNGYSNVIVEEQKRFCDSFAAKPYVPSKIILFPDEPFNWSGSGAAIVGPENTNFPETGALGYILPVVVACVNYQFRDSPRVYQTRALYEVFRSDSRTRFFEVGRGVPADQIFLVRNEFADDAY